ncbi:hypothetical protein OB919_16060 [Halobacteria archaeon AArc-curdl1]|uniref:Uncharacterized protein n=1 Tax=Natronosalvus hydrolyticus TaxID=2979988 RepID=A0AAP2ZBG6_9EURY|nr:hypothetical protein [Halobacteria archaeon AArc-curdl1]
MLEKDNDELHRLEIYEPTFRKYVKDYDPEEEEWSPSYLKREGLYKMEYASNKYGCTCGEFFEDDQEAAENHIKEILEGGVSE